MREESTGVPMRRQQYRRTQARGAIGWRLVTAPVARPATEGLASVCPVHPPYPVALRLFTLVMRHNTTALPLSLCPSSQPRVAA